MPICGCPLVEVSWLCILFCMCAYTWGVAILSPGVLTKTPQATLSHLYAHPTNGAQFHTLHLQHPREGGPGPNQDHKGGSLHLGKQSHS